MVREGLRDVRRERERGRRSERGREGSGCGAREVRTRSDACLRRGCGGRLDGGSPNTVPNWGRLACPRTLLDPYLPGPFPIHLFKGKQYAARFWVRLAAPFWVRLAYPKEVRALYVAFQNSTTTDTEIP